MLDAQKVWRRYTFLLASSLIVFACGQHDEVQRVDPAGAGPAAPWARPAPILEAAKPTPPSACTAAILNVGATSSMAPGAQVMLGVTASCSGPTAEYSFSYTPSSDPAHPIRLRDFAASPTFVWDTSGLATGSYSVVAAVRASGSASSATGFGKVSLGTTTDPIALNRARNSKLLPPAAAKPAPDFAAGIQAKSLGSSALTTYPLSADGKYYNVNLLHRNFLPPTANATFANGAYQLGAFAAPRVLDGSDSALNWSWETDAGNPDPTVTLTVDMGEYFSVGAVRPLYSPGAPGSFPITHRIRLATTPGQWHEVVGMSPVVAADATFSFEAWRARYLELTMVRGGQLDELFVYPSAQTSPPPTSAEGYDLSSFTTGSTVNDNFFASGTTWPLSWPACAFFPKTVANGGTEGDAVATVDLGAQFDVSRLELGFYWSTPWVNGGRLEVAATPDAFTTIYDSGSGQPFTQWPVLPEFSFPSQPVRYIRATDYFTPGVGASAGVLWSVQAFQTPTPHVGYYPLSADGRYFNVNLARRPTGDIQPTASVVYVNGVTPPWSPQSQIAGNAIDGDDNSLVLWTNGAADPVASATLTVNLGQVESIGAIRQIYGYPPVSSSIRVAETLDGPWTQVVALDTPAAAGESTSSFATASAQYVELTMTGTPAVGFFNLAELQVFPSSASDPAPGSGSHLELGYLTGMTASWNANMGVGGGYQIHSATPYSYYVKTAAQGATGDATLTLDLGQQYQVSELTLSWLYGETWPAGGKVDVDDGSGTWVQVFDSQRGTPLGSAADGSQRIPFGTAHTARHVRLTGYFDPSAPQGFLTNIEVFGSDNVPPGCVKQCSGKVCGGNLDDGCGGVCAGVCTTGQIGCAANADCAPGSICTNRSPDPAAPRLCVAILCGPTCSATCPCSGGATCLAPSECATNFSCEQSVCACQPSCAGKACGAPDGCGGVCNDGCGPGDTCQPGGCLAGLSCSPMGGTSGSPSTTTNVCMGLGLPLSPPKQRPYTTLPSDADALLPSASPGQYAPGRLAGTSSVDSAGAFSYRVPIEVPPGRAGMEPHLALSYSSSGGNGLLGVGWNLEGTSSIARCRKVVAREGVADSVKVKASCASGALCPEQTHQYNDAIDNFCLDGQKLVKVGGTPASPEFRTERDSFARIVATYSGDNWPSKFTVWNRDGTIATYPAGIVGTGVDSRDPATGAPTGRSFPSVLAWPIGSLQDRFGNGVSYSYDAADQGSAAQVLTTIEYTTCASGSACPYGGATRIVRFNYEPRPDYLSHWVAGLNAGIALRLHSVSVFTGSAVDETLVRYYNLGYDASGATARSRLTSITPCDGRNSCLAPTTFQWGSGQGSDFRNTWNVIGPDAPGTVAPGQCTPGNVAPGCFRATFTKTVDMRASVQLANPFLVGDFDGNGSDDLIFFTGPDLDNLTYWLALSHPADGTVTFEFIRLDLNGDNPALAGTSAFYSRAVDIDQDGQAELVLEDGHRGDTGFVVDDYSVYSYSAVVKNFAPLRRDDGTTVVLNTPSSAVPAGAPAMLDVNGDGVLDYFYDGGSFQDDGHSHAYYLSKAIISGSRLLPQNYTPAIPLSYGPTPGDEDLFNQGKCRLQPVDYAGHGYRAPGLTCDDTTSSTLFADLNGDGLEDILKINAGVFNFATLRLSTGVELVGDSNHEADAVVHPEGQALPPLLLANAFGSSSSAFSVGQNQVADFNGDGLADIVQFDTGTVTEPPALWLAGTSDATGATLTKVVLPYTRPRNVSSTHQVNQRVGDFNGDGLPDIVQTVDYSSSDFAGSLQFLIQDPRNRDDVITNVTSDSIELADLTYQAGPTEQLGPDGTDTVVPIGGNFTPRRGLNVVKKATLVEGQTRSTSSYYYTQPAADTLGRGFLGFGAIIKADWEHATKTSSFFDNARIEGALYGYHLFPYAFTPTEVDIESGAQALSNLQWDAPFAPGSAILVTRSEQSTVQRRIHALNPPSGALGPTSTYFIEDYFSRTSKQDESGGDYYTAFVSRTYDDFGNVTDSTSNDGPEETVVHSNFVNDTSAKWVMSQFQDSTTRFVRNDFRVPGNTQTATPRLLRHTYGDDGELRTITDTPNGWRTQTFTLFTRDSAGLVRSVDVTDAFGNERGSSFDYSIDGVYKEHIQDALGHDTWVGYHSGLGVPLISFDANGNQTLYRYDGFDRLRVAVPTRASTTNITYAQAGGAMSVTTQQSPGTTVTKQYTDLGKVASVRTNIGGNTSLVEYTWDDLGQLRVQSTPRFLDHSLQPDTTYSYDNLSNVRLVTKPDGSTVSINLLDGLTTETITSSSDDKTHDVVVTKTEDGLVDSVRENSPGAAVPTRGVDYVYGQGKQIVQVNELGGPTTTYYSYGQPKPAYVVSSESGTTTLIYDGFGNPQSVIHDPAFPAREDYVFDSLGRLTLLSATTPDALHLGQTLSERTSYTYDVGQGAIGKLSSSSSPDGVTTNYMYTPEGLLTEKDYESGPDAFRVGYHRDPYGRVDHIDYPETGQARFGVDLSFNDIAGGPKPDGSLSAVSRYGANYWSTRTRGPTGMAESILLGNDSIETINVDPMTRQIDSINVANSTGEPVYNVEYGYFVGGNVKTRTDNVAGPVTSTNTMPTTSCPSGVFRGPGVRVPKTIAMTRLATKSSLEDIRRRSGVTVSVPIS